MRTKLMRAAVDIPSAKKRQHRESGYLIISSAVAVMVIAALISLAGDRMIQENRIERAQQVGRSLAILGDGLEAFLHKYYDEIATGKRIEDVTNPVEISPDQLIKLMALKGVSTSVPNMPDAKFGISIDVPSRASSGASCTNQNNRYVEPSCRISGLAFIDKPLMRSGKVDTLATARAVRTIGAHGGYAPPNAPGSILFLSANSKATPVPTRNPAGGRAGIMARLVDPVAQSGSVSEFLRIDGKNTMLATLKMQNSMTGIRHDIIGVGRLTASGNIETSAGTVMSGYSPTHGTAAAWMDAHGEIVSAKGNVIAREGALRAEKNDIYANRFAFNQRSLSARGSVRIDQACGGEFAVAPGPAPYDASIRRNISSQYSQEYLYVCTHDVYFSGPELRVHQGVIWGTSSGNSNPSGHAPRSPYPVNEDNPGYYRSPYRVWRPIDQKQAVTQRFMLTDEASYTAKLGYWQICADVTPLAEQYNATGGGHFMPIVKRMWQDLESGEWYVNYERYTHSQRGYGYWGRVVCSGKI